LTGLPEEFQKLLEQMMTAAERNDPDNAKKAVNILVTASENFPSESLMIRTNWPKGTTRLRLTAFSMK
jgi:hypothetical protein